MQLLVSVKTQHNLFLYVYTCEHKQARHRTGTWHYSYLTDKLFLISYVCHSHINSTDLSTNYSQHLCFLATAFFFAHGSPYLSPCVFFLNGPWGQTGTLPKFPSWQSQIRMICGLTLVHAVSEWVPGIAWPVIMVCKPHWGCCQHCASVHFAYSETIDQHPRWSSQSLAINLFLYNPQH